MLKIHEAIEPMIHKFRKALEVIIGKDFYGLYLYNSVALGKFEPKGSDIDFVVILNRPLSTEVLGQLALLHREIEQSFPYGERLDGMYLLKENIGKGNGDMLPYPYANGGDFYNEGFYDVNNVTWWVIKEHECAIESPSLKKHLENFSFDSVLKTLSYNVHQYWAPKLKTPEIFAEDMWVEFSVLTLSRIYYTLDTGNIISKREACLSYMDAQPHWQDVIEEALAVREGESGRVIHDASIRKDRILCFVTHLVTLCQSMLEKRGIYGTV